MEVNEIEISKIKQIDNSRINSSIGEDLHELMASIDAHGLLQPIGVVKNDGYYSIAWGNRRLEAFKKLDLKKIPAVIVKDATSEKEFLLLNLVENLSRDNLNVFELGRSFLSLVEQGLSEAEVAVKLGMSKSKVVNCIQAYKHMPEKYRFIVKSMTNQRHSQTKGKISLSTSSHILHMQKELNMSKKEVEELFDLAKSKNLNNRSIRVICRLIKAGLSIKQAYEKSKEYCIIETWLVLKTKEYEKLMQEKNSLTVQGGLTPNQALDLSGDGWDVNLVSQIFKKMEMV